MQKQFDTPHPVSLYVEVGSGTVTVHTEDTSQTVIDVNGHDAEDVIVEQRGDEIVVVAPQRRAGFFSGSREIDVRVSMPHLSRLATKLGSADVRVVGRLGETMLRTGSGDMRIDQVDADAFVETGSGDVEIDRVGGELRVRSGSGNVEVDTLDGAATISTGSGDVRLGTASGAVQVKSGSGDMRVREALRDVVLSTASGDLTVEAIRPGQPSQLVAKNVSGDIRVGVPGGVPVWTDITSMTGTVRSNLEGAGQPGEGQDYIELRAKTVSGDIYLEQV